MGASIPLSVVAVIPLAFLYYRMMQYVHTTEVELHPQTFLILDITSQHHESLNDLTPYRDLRFSHGFRYGPAMVSETFSDYRPQETLGGLSTIRSFQLRDLFCHINEMRSDTNLKAYLPSTYVNRSVCLIVMLTIGTCSSCYRWLAVRLEYVESSLPTQRGNSQSCLD